MDSPLIVTFPFIELCVGTLFGILSAVWHPFTRSFTNKEAIHPDGFFVSPACGLTARGQSFFLATSAISGQRLMMYCTAFRECGTMQSVQFLTPVSV